MKPTLLILAAGMGSRYGGLKQLDGLGPSDETIIDYSVYDAARAGFGKVVFVIRESFADEFKSNISDKYKGLIEVEHVFQELDTPIEGVDYATEREKPWGTGHAVLVAKNLINEPFAVINADDYYGADGFKTICDFLSTRISPEHYAMVGYILEKTLSDHGSVSRGVCTEDENGFLTDVVERTNISRENGSISFQENGEKVALDPESIVSMNFWGFHPNVFDFITDSFRDFAAANRDNPRSEFYIPYFVNKMLEEKLMDMTVLKSRDQWFGVTYKEDREMVQNAFANLTETGKYPTPLW